jgi:hypothetical protein
MNRHLQIILSLLIVSVLSKAQIPNNSFEFWTITSGYQTPDNWDNLNLITYSSGIYTCIKGSPGYSGASYLYLISKAIPGKGIVPGVAVCGEIDTITYQPKSGFSYTERPQSLSYFIQFMPYDPTDSSSVKILLTKWNQAQLKRDTIAYGESYFNSMAHSWFNYSTYLNYFSSSNPDSAIIVISSSSSLPKEGSYIYIDDLQFNGMVIGIEENRLNSNYVSISPNPSSEFITIKLNSETAFPVEVIIYDCFGDIISKNSFFSQSNVLNISNWSKGIYTVQVRNEKNILNKKLLIN